MLSILAIVVAGFSLTCIVITVYRNLPPEPERIVKSDHGDIEAIPSVNSLTGANGPPPPPSTPRLPLSPSLSFQQVIVGDNELQVIL